MQHKKLTFSMQSNVPETPDPKWWIQLPNTITFITPLNNSSLTLRNNSRVLLISLFFYSFFISSWNWFTYLISRVFTHSSSLSFSSSSESSAKSQSIKGWTLALTSFEWQIFLNHFTMASSERMSLSCRSSMTYNGKKLMKIHKIGKYYNYKCT